MNPKLTELNFPNFLIIGAGKCGTTSVHNYLNQHPDIFMCPIKETNFFSYYNININDHLDDLNFINHYKSSITDLNAFSNLFSKALPNQIKGETSSSYFYNYSALKNIKELINDPKFIVFLRQPAERLYSRYLHLARENELPSEKFEDLFEPNTVWWSRPDLINEGFYFQHLSMYLQHFPASSFKIYLYEDLKNYQLDILQDIFRFLDLDDSFVPKTDIEFNQSGFIKSNFVNNLIGGKGVISKVGKKKFPKAYKQIKNNYFIRKTLNKIRVKNLIKPKLELSLRNRITNEIYYSDIKNLAKTINKNLQHWF